MLNNKPLWQLNGLLDKHKRDSVFQQSVKDFDNTTAQLNKSPLTLGHNESTLLSKVINYMRTDNHAYRIKQVQPKQSFWKKNWEKTRYRFINHRLSKSKFIIAQHAVDSLLQGKSAEEVKENLQEASGFLRHHLRYRKRPSKTNLIPDFAMSSPGKLDSCYQAESAPSTIRSARKRRISVLSSNAYEQSWIQTLMPKKHTKQSGAEEATTQTFSYTSFAELMLNGPG